MDIQKPTMLDAARLAGELDLLKGATISQAVHGDSPSVLCLIIGQRKALRHLVQKRYAYIGMTAEVSENLSPVTALTGLRITGASQVAGDRIVSLNLEKEDRLGRTREFRLILEIMPNHGNAILTDENGAIKWALRKKETGTYHPPAPLKKATVLNFDKADIITKAENPGDIKTHVYGLNFRDLINLGLEKYGSTREALDAIAAYVAKAKEAGPAWIVFQGETAVGFSLASPLLDEGERAEQFDTALKMYEQYYTLATGQGEEQDHLETLLRIIDREMERERGKLGALKKELAVAESARLFKKYGELILANIDAIPRGAKKAKLEDLESGEQAYYDVDLDPSKAASANAEAYFKKYKKATSSLNMIISRMESAEKRLAELESVRADFGDDPERLEEELARLKLVAKTAASAKARAPVPRRLPYKRFWATSGWEILVGRTNKDNDELTFHVAAKDDYWFHAWQAAGSHTVLRPPNRQAIPDKQTLLEAAALAAYFSKARTSSKVPVAYTQVKFVHKPKKFPPGKVLVEKEKQLMVKPANPEHYQRQEESE